MNLAYTGKEVKEMHRGIIMDICLLVNHCADCSNDEAGEVECFPMHCLGLYKMTSDSFCIEPYASKINNNLFDIAKKYGYKVRFVIENKTIAWIKFCKC